MQALRSFKVATATIMLIVATNSSAYVQPSNLLTSEVGIKVIRPAMTEATNVTGSSSLDEQVDMRTGMLRLITLASTAEKAHALSRASIINAAKEFLKNHADLFLRDGVQYKLDKDSLLIDQDVQFVRFLVQFQGLNVYDAHVDLRFKMGHLLQVQNFSFIEATETMSVQSFSASQRASAAANALPAEHLQYQGDLYRVEEAKDGYSLVRVSEYVSTSNGISHRIQVRHDNATVYEIAPTQFYAIGTADSSTYPRAWNQDQIVLSMPLLNLTLPNNTSIQTAADGSFNYEDGQSFKINGFRGKHVKVSASTGGLATATSVLENGQLKLSFRANPNATKHSDKLMSQAVTYDHINRIVAFAKNFIAPTWFNSALSANVNLNQTCNAFWNGSSVNFFSAGGNCANTGLSSDVVYHEWGHGLDANTGGISDGAFSEGFGDIMSLLMSGDAKLGVGFYTNGRGIRDLEPNKIYPRDRGGVHAEGLIIGSTFYDLYQSLVASHGAETARLTLAKYAFKGVYAARRYTDMYNALLVIDDDDANMENLTPNFCALNTAFSAHGLATKSARCEG